MPASHLGHAILYSESIGAVELLKDAETSIDQNVPQIVIFQVPHMNRTRCIYLMSEIQPLGSRSFSDSVKVIALFCHIVIIWTDNEVDLQKRHLVIEVA